MTASSVLQHTSEVRQAQQTPAETAAPQPQPKLAFHPTADFNVWLAEQGVSLAFTTYQTGKLFLLGSPGEGQLSLFERSFNRCMGLCASPDTQTLYMSMLYQLWRFENTLEAGQDYAGYDRLYVPQLAYTTGDLDIHDIALDGSGQPVFVNTLFNCLATVSATHSFKPLWKPPFISQLAPEDRCHLNGQAMQDGQPRYVTLVGESDVNNGWREHRADGGMVMAVESNEVIARGLSMPHSPRVYQDRLWLLQSGTGELGVIDAQTGKFEPVAFCPGYLRGLNFVGDYALVGLSLPRKNKAFQDLPLDNRLGTNNAEARCGLRVIDLRSGEVVHALDIEGIVEELYDVVVLPQVRRPMALGFKRDEIRRVITIEAST